MVVLKTLTRKEIIREEIKFLKQDLEPLQNSLSATFNVNPLAILGVLFFSLTVLIAGLAAIIRIVWA